LDCDIIARALRTAEPPVIGRIEHDRVLIDLRTILPNDDVRAMGSVYRALSTILE
jgi:L-seryl-tRNA(Ser) seleniumtransferase